jgi:hypothetical protein
MLRKIGICCLTFSFMCGLARGQRTSQPWQNDDPTLHHEIITVIRIVNELRPGKTRADILKYFTTEGDPSSRDQNHYVYKRCPCIKIDVTFTADPKDFMRKSATDKIATISKPYLELAAAGAASGD